MSAHVPNLGPLVPVAWDEEELVVWARLYDGHWNGWALPAFDRENVERIMAWNNEASATYPDIDRLAWDGDTIVMSSSLYPGEDQRIEPGADDQGVLRWPIGAWYWTWYEVERPACRACGWSQVGHTDAIDCPKCGQPFDWA